MIFLGYPNPHSPASGTAAVTDRLAFSVIAMRAKHDWPARLARRRRRLTRSTQHEVALRSWERRPDAVRGLRAYADDFEGDERGDGEGDGDRDLEADGLGDAYL